MNILGIIEIDGQNKYLNIEKNRNLYKYYLDEQFIGVYDPTKMIEDKIIFRENTIENELSADAKDKIVQFLEDEEIGEILKNIEFETDEIEENKNEKGIGNKEKKKEEKPKEEKEKNEEEINKEEELEEKPEKHVNTVKDINIKETIDMDEKVTDMRDLGQVMKDTGNKTTVDGQKITKIGIVESDEIDNLVNEKGQKYTGNTSRYAVVGITKDGTVDYIDLEQDSSDGTNPDKENYQVSQDGEVEKDDVSTRLKVGNGTLGIENEGGEIKVHHSSGKSFGGNEQPGNMSLDRELGNSKTGNLTGMKKEIRDLASDVKDGYRNVQDIYEETEGHQEEDCEELETEDIDGDENTKSHQHEENIDFKKLAREWGFRDENGEEKAKLLYKKTKEAEPNKTSEEIIEQIDEELNEQVQGNRTR